MARSWQNLLLIGAVLLASHGVSAWHFAARYASQTVRTSLAPLTLNLTPNQWAAATAGADSSCYLLCAQQVAAGRGIALKTPNSDPPRLEPFVYWGPGCPWVLGQWQRLVGGATMWSFCAFAVVAQLIFGALAVATAALWTRNTWALAATALATGVCPPMQDWFYGYALTSSEIVSLPIWALIFYVLSKGFLAYRATALESTGRMRRWRVWPWFALAGVLIGIESLVRDSSEVFALFVAVFLVARALLLDRRQLVLVLSAAVLLVGATALVRRPVRGWNVRRIGVRVVSTSTEGSIWRFGLWVRHDMYDWYEQSGLGFGQYLDPDAPARVEQYYRDKLPSPALYSLGQLLQAIARHPSDAVAFKLSRLPVLWLGTDRWPNARLSLTVWWCLAFYTLLAVYCVVRWRRKQPIPEVLYLYLLLLVAASPLIHFEFRYTFPVWNTLVIVPGLLIGAVAEARQARRKLDNRTDAERPTSGLGQDQTVSPRSAA